eukprot:15345513-Ditylum_brightwellii.AAC.1
MEYRKSSSSSRKGEKKKYLKVCPESWKSFIPSIVTMDGVFEYKAQLLMKHLVHILSKKWACHMSYEQNYITTMMIIGMVYATH